jgi:UDP-N-acetylmuramoyl-L-alanyl-D-glutamate--2,6-diaminopimelate ligase
MIRSGSLFVAISGFQTDGNEFVDEAVSRGAVAVVTEKETSKTIPQVIVPDARAALADFSSKFYKYDGQQIKICGVTGTNGKTTSCFLLKNILAARGKRVGLITSLVYDTGRDQIPAERTTPESLEIYRLLYSMKKNHCVNAVLEISSHALTLHRVRNLNIQVALFTNISRDHLDFHHDMQDYINAKAQLLDMVASEDKWAVINYDCPEFREFLERLNCSHMTYSLRDSSADVYLNDYQLNPDGSRIELVTPMGIRTVNLKLHGKLNLYNALAAAGAAMASGVDLDTVVIGLEKSTVIPGRLERLENNAPFSVFIDFAHTPDALKRTIETLREISNGRILTLFGCGGDRDRGKRPIMGRMVTTNSDYSVLTADNPRNEDLGQIIDDVKPGFAQDAPVEIIDDRKEAIIHILRKAQENDIILLAGKGAEEHQEIDGIRHPFSDRKVAIEELEKLGYGN